MNASHAVLAVVGIAGLGVSIWNETPRGKVGAQIIGPRSKRPVQNARVVLIDQNGLWHRAKTNQNGEFSLQIPAGRYELRAQSGRWRSKSRVEILEAQTVSPEISLRWVPPNVPTDQPFRDPQKVVARAREIVSGRVFLTRETLLAIAKNNQSGWPLPYVVAQAGAESSFRPALDGPLDEVGLFQLRPETARDMAGREVSPQELRDPGFSTRLASRYLAFLMRYFGKKRLALGSYNQGPGRTEREGLFPIAQIYADAITLAARDESLKRRVLELAPELESEWKWE